MQSKNQVPGPLRSLLACLYSTPLPQGQTSKAACFDGLDKMVWIIDDLAPLRNRHGRNGAFICKLQFKDCGEIWIS